MIVAKDRKERILEVAERLVQTRGYDGFSYADVADAIGIRKASVHHHFPAKGDLARSLVDRFRSACRAAFARILHRHADPVARLKGYCQLFEDTLADGGQMCLCGMLSAGHVSLPDDVRDALLDALREHENWLAAVLRSGQKAGLIRAEIAPRLQAQAVLSVLEGAMLLARVTGDRSRLTSAARVLLDGIRVARPPAESGILPENDQ